MLAKALEGHSVVFARRTYRVAPWSQRFTSWLFYRLLALISPIRLDPTVTNFSIVSRDVVKVLRGMRENLRFYGGMLVWAGFDFATIEYPHQERFAGKSSYSFFRRLSLAARNTFAYSNLPLIYSTFVGIGVAALAFLMVFYYLAIYFIRGDVPEGWTTLAVALFFIGGFIIFQVGISGIYLGEVFNEVRRRPLYIVAEATGFEADRPVHRFGRLTQEGP
jgi:dolichol-phosphate mannosyltransferase